jgi:hypothetical protein
MDIDLISDGLEKKSKLSEVATKSAACFAVGKPAV